MSLLETLLSDYPQGLSNIRNLNKKYNKVESINLFINNVKRLLLLLSDKHVNFQCDEMIHICKTKVQVLEDIIRKNENINIIKAELDNSKKHIECLEVSLKNYNEEKEKFMSIENDLNKQIYNNNEIIKNLENKISNLQDIIAKNEDLLNNSIRKSELEECKSQLNKANLDMNKLVTERNEFENNQKYYIEQLENTKKELDSSNVKIFNLEYELNKEKNNIKISNSKLENIQNKLTQNKNKYYILVNKYSKLKQEIASLNESKFIDPNELSSYNKNILNKAKKLIEENDKTLTKLINILNKNLPDDSVLKRKIKENMYSIDIIGLFNLILETKEESNKRKRKIPPIDSFVIPNEILEHDNQIENMLLNN